MIHLPSTRPTLSALPRSGRGGTAENGGSLPERIGATRAWLGRLALGFGLLAAVWTTPVQAQNWIPVTGGNWSDTGNWDTGIPNSSTADASIKYDLTAEVMITFTENITLNALRYEDTGSGTDQRLIIRPGTGYTLTFAGSDPIVDSGSTTGGLRIDSVIDLGSAGVTKIGNGMVRFNNAITGSGTLKISTGTLEIGGDSSGFTGDIVIDGGVLQGRGFSGTGTNLLGDTAHDTTINNNGQFMFRDTANKISSEKWILNGINTTGSITMFASSNVTIDGTVTLNHDSSFSVRDYTVGTVGTKREFFINSVIADGVGSNRAYFLGNFSGASAQGTEGRLSEIILGANSTYGGNTYITTNIASDANGPFSGNLRLGIDNALPTATTVVLGGSHAVDTGILGHAGGNGKLIMNGHNQELTGLLTNGTGAENRVVGNSATLSTLTLTIAASTTNTYRGVLGGISTDDNNLKLIKAGDGTLELTATNTYTGDTTVSDGTLRASNTSGSATGTGEVTVLSGATLDGTGTIGGATTVDAGATLTGGTNGTTGTLKFSNGLDASGSTWLVDLVETTSGDSDLIAVTGNLNISGAIFTPGTFSGSHTSGNSYNIASYSGTLTGTFLLGATPWLDGEQKTLGSGLYEINYNNGGFITLTAVPEPTTLLPLAALLLALKRRRSRSKELDYRSIMTLLMRRR